MATKARWQQAADAASMSLSEFVRMAVDDWLGPHDSTAPAEVVERRKAEITGAPPAPEPHEAGYKRLPDQHFKPDFKK